MLEKINNPFFPIDFSRAKFKLEKAFSFDMGLRLSPITKVEMNT